MPGKRVLVVDDDTKTVELVKLYLNRDGYRVITAYDGNEALKLARDSHPDLIVLDLMLPGISGLEICRTLRNESDVPIIMLTALTTDDDRLQGLDIGADDYVTKPFSPKTLVARVKALLRRADRMPETDPDLYRYETLTMNRSRHEVSLGQQEVTLTTKEFGLLEHLLRHRGRVLTREVLLNAVWGYDYYGTTRTVDVHVRRLKQKLPLLEDAIVSVKSLGYKLKDIDEPG